jgi:hypothetical protein
MSYFDNPLAAADTVAPLRREWPENPRVEMPAFSNNSLTLSTRDLRLKGPNELENSGWDGSRGIVYKDVVVHVQDRGGRLVMTQAGLQFPCGRGRFSTLGE